MDVDKLFKDAEKRVAPKVKQLEQASDLEFTQEVVKHIIRGLICEESTINHLLEREFFGRGYGTGESELFLPLKSGRAIIIQIGVIDGDKV